MPKGKHKKKNDNSNNRNSFLLPRMEVISPSDDDSANDNGSVISSISGSTIYEDTHFGDEVLDQTQQIELFEDKLSDSIDGMFEKSAQSRVNNIDAVSAALMKKFIPDFVSQRRFTIMDAIERSLKKGRANEQASVAQLAALLCLQLGSTNAVEEICLNLIPTLLLIISDNSMSCLARAKCCWALGLLAFIGNYENIESVMEVLRQTYRISFTKNIVGTTLLAEETSLYTNALSAWCLLQTVSSITDSLPIYLKEVVSLLDSNSVDIRMAAGEVIAVVLEQLKEYESVEEWEPDEDVLNKLRELATDSHKFRAKKDRKTQRSVFRDIIQYIEENKFPKVQVRFGQECLILDTWCRKKHYDVFCQALGSGMNLHLKENDLLRDVLNLGEKVTTLSSPLYKQTKLERQLMNAAAFKARSICRAKHRDKRTISIA